MRIVNFKPFSIALAIILLFALVVLFSSSPVFGDLQSAQSSRPNLAQDARGEVKLSVNRTTGAASFVQIPGGLSSQPRALFVQSTAEAAAGAFLVKYGELFGVADAQTELVYQGTVVDNFGNAHAAYQQVYRQVPVFAGELKVHMNDKNAVTAANGTFIPKIAIDVTPTLTPEEAELRATFATELSCNTGSVGFEFGIPDSWNIVDNAGSGLIWSDIAGSGIGGNFTGGSDNAASVSSDAFGPADFDTELRSNVFSLATVYTASLEYLVNYQNYANADFLDLDISNDGGASWTNLLRWNEDHGDFFAQPGEPVAIDLTAYSGQPNLQLRWRYYDPSENDWDWYAQVDDVTLMCNRALDCLQAYPSRGTLWPPNHRYAPINILGVTDPDGDDITINIDTIYQDEPVRGRGSGNTGLDGRGVGTSTAEVRAERNGRGNGRVYHIGFTAFNSNGASCSSDVLVSVPHNKGDTAVDGGALFNSRTR